MYDDLLARLRSSNPDDVGKASVAFAQLLWDGKVNDVHLMSLLEDPNDVVRSEIAWAIADAHRPLAGIKWLVKQGLLDRAEGVRFWATQYLTEADIDAAALVEDQLVKMQNDSSQRVRENVRTLFGRLDLNS